MAMSAVCLFSGTLGVSNFISASSILRADDVLERPFSDVLNTASIPVVLSRRQIINNAAETTNGDIKLNSDGTLNRTAWEETTNAACVKALMPLPRSTNPSGNCICYNLPALDTNTGVFEAELRLYRISDARDAFSGIPPENVKVALQYNGASVSPISATGAIGIGNQTQVLSPRDAVSAPRLVQAYMFVGQIDKAKMAQNMSLYVYLLPPPHNCVLVLRPVALPNSLTMLPTVPPSRPSSSQLSH